MKISFHTALITGGSRGLGRAIALKLAKEAVKKSVKNLADAAGSAARARRVDIPLDALSRS